MAHSRCPNEGRSGPQGGDRRDRLVPLQPQAVEVLNAITTMTADLPFVFPSDRHVHKPISENALRALLIRAGYYQRHVPHGFRSAFSTIMNEQAVALSRPNNRAIIDLMLAHVPSNQVESAYNRAAFMPRRREIALAWATRLMENMPQATSLLGRPCAHDGIGGSRFQHASGKEWTVAGGQTRNGPDCGTVRFKEDEVQDIWPARQKSGCTRRRARAGRHA